MVTYKLKNFTFVFLMTTFLIGHPALKRHILALSSIGIMLFSESYWWLRNNRNIMLNFQINSYFELGRETREFICFFENDGFGMLEENKENNRLLGFWRPSAENNDNKKNNFEIKKDEKSGFYLIYDKDGNLKAQFIKNPSYYKKFFVKEIYDVKFEKEDEIIDYLDMDLNYDFHKEYLKKLSTSQGYKSNSQDLLSMIR
jgi:hypothetical protein